AAASQRTAPGVQQPCPQRLQKPRTAVVGGTAADPQDDPPGTGLQLCQYQLAGTEGGGYQGIALRRGDPVQAAGCGHLDTCLAVAQPAPVRLYQFTQGTAYRFIPALPRGSGKQGFDSPLTPIGPGTQMQQGIGEGPPPARGY